MTRLIVIPPITSETLYVSLYRVQKNASHKSCFRPIYYGPYKILRKISPVNYEVELMNQIGKAFKRDVVHVSKLKPVEVRDGEGNNEWFDLTEPDIETIAPDESVDTFSNPCFRRALFSYTYNQFYF
jgi:hypothetical protein